MSTVLAIDRLCAGLTANGAGVLSNISIHVAAGEVHGLVGMSGAGKSMIAKAVLGVLPPAVRVTSGSIRFCGTEIIGLSRLRMRQLLARGIALIPQDPLTALNPTRRIEAQMTDVMRARLGLDAKTAHQRALSLLEEVHIREPASVLRRYPHEISGGQRQRVLIAIAFACNPKLIIADEPTTALDVTVQKQILRLIHDLRGKHGTAILLVTHDLGVVAKICDSLSVMHAGVVVEKGKVDDIIKSPAHPFTRALFAATPRHDRPGHELRPVPEALLRDVVEASRR